MHSRGRSVEGYAYGKEGYVAYNTYSIGDQVSYNNVDYYVIKDTDSNVTLLKAEPLTVAEVNQYGTGHVNRYISYSVGTANNNNGYGGTAYYSSETCGYPSGNYVYTSCTTDYAQSEIIYAVDAWKIAEAPQATDARLITYEELTTDLGCSSSTCTNSSNSWLYNSKYWYWTMSSYNNSESRVWLVKYDSYLTTDDVRDYDAGVVRPVITLDKSVIEN